jgi:hypothetical protein
MVLFAAGVLVAVRLTTGRGLGLRSLPRAVFHQARSLIDHKRVIEYNQGDFTNIIFLHHSTGNNLIEKGGVRESFTQAGYDFWDHSYNNPGLRDPSGTYTGYSYNVPRDNTDPDGLAEIYTQRIYDQPFNTLSGLFQHEVIIFKSCFAPGNQIESDEQLAQYKAWYLGIRKVIDQHPEKLFIVVTMPPLNPADTNPKQATRARAFAGWLKSEEYLNGHANLVVFDFYNYLAEDDPARADYNMLRDEYRNGADSHPNRLANQTLGPIFVDFVIGAIDQYREISKSLE